MSQSKGTTGNVHTNETFHWACSSGLAAISSQVTQPGPQEVNTLQCRHLCLPSFSFSLQCLHYTDQLTEFK